jgi:hypothetical protein
MGFGQIPQSRLQVSYFIFGKFGLDRIISTLEIAKGDA